MESIHISYWVMVPRLRPKLNRYRNLRRSYRAVLVILATYMRSDILQNYMDFPSSSWRNHYEHIDSC